MNSSGTIRQNPRINVRAEVLVEDNHTPINIIATIMTVRKLSRLSKIYESLSIVTWCVTLGEVSAKTLSCDGGLH